MTVNMQDWPCALGLPRLTAVFRQQPEDFRVDEVLGFEPDGAGEHLWLQVEKTGFNTIDVARILARLTGVKERDIGYAGLKDRQAVATQWFSVAGAEPISSGMPTGLRLLQQVRNSRKMRRGSHRGNRFVITLRDVQAGAAELDEWQTRLGKAGVPNYFGPQRFGLDGGNLDKARRYFSGCLPRVPRHQRGLYFSAARAYLFNLVLAERVRQGTWNRILPGEIMALDGSNSVFRAEPEDTGLPTRLADGDIHPTGPMWGKGDLATGNEVKELEEAVVNKYTDLADGLVQAGLEQERRALRVIPGQLAVKPAGQDAIMIEFSLPRGAFATSVLREMVIAVGL
jgi:tRNA pseudouridine13 synthase